MMLPQLGQSDIPTDGYTVFVVVGHIEVLILQSIVLLLP